MNVNNRTVANVSGLVFLTTIAAFIFFRLQVLNSGDDHFFQNALNHKGLIEYLDGRYHSWTGRMLIEGLMTLTINTPLYWQVAIPTSFVVITYAFCGFAGVEKSMTIVGMCFVSILMLLINHNIMTDAAWWVTGSYNYIQPIAAGLISLSIYEFYRGRSITLKGLSLALVCFSCFSEQFAILVVLPYVLLSSFIKRDFSKYKVIYTLVIISSIAFSLTAPGNSARKLAEIGTWMPDYANFNIIDKAAIGFDRLSSHITESNILFSLFLIVILIASFRKNNLSLSIACASLIVSFKIAISMIDAKTSVQLDMFTNSSYLLLGDVYDLSRFTPYIFSLLVLFSALTLLISICEEMRDHINITVPFVLGVISVVIIGLSPTAYASAYRILFLFNLSIIYVILYIANNKFRVKLKK